MAQNTDSTAVQLWFADRRMSHLSLAFCFSGEYDKVTCVSKEVRERRCKLSKERMVYWLTQYNGLLSSPEVISEVCTVNKSKGSYKLQHMYLLFSSYFWLLRCQERVKLASIKKDQSKERYKEVPVQFSSVTQSCLTHSDSMDYSMPSFPAHHQPLELAQTHVHQIGDAI